MLRISIFNENVILYTRCISVLTQNILNSNYPTPLLIYIYSNYLAKIILIFVKIKLQCYSTIKYVRLSMFFIQIQLEQIYRLFSYFGLVF